jgi:RHS repeat-associated protein
VVTDQTAAAVQSTQYYPFGMAFATSTGQDGQRFKYNDKELDLMHGLNMYDYSARGIDMANPRFTTQDPLAEKYYSISPYAYCANNPLKYIDTDGRKIVDATGRIMYKDGQWLSNATDGAKLIASNMQLTPVGREAFNNLTKANYGVELIYDQTSDIGKVGRSEREFDGNGNTTQAKITVFEKNLVEDLNDLTKLKNSGQDPVAAGATDAQQTMIKEGIPTQNERIGQVGVHESEHIVNPNAWKSAGGNFESVAAKAEIKAIKETVMLKPLPVPKLEFPTPLLNKINLP